MKTLKRVVAVLVSFFLLTPLPLPYAATRQVVEEDLARGTGTLTSGGVTGNRINLGTFTFPQDNVTPGDSTNLYKVATATPYTLMYIDGTGTLQFLAFTGTNQCVTVTGPTGALALGPCGGVASLDNTTMDGTEVGQTDPDLGTFTVLRATEQASVDNNAPIKIGTHWRLVYDSTNKQMLFDTPETASFDTSTPMFAVRFNKDNNSLSPAQSLVQIYDYITSLFKLDSSGNLTILGTLLAAQLETPCNPADNECYQNTLNAGPPADNTAGNCGFDNTANAWGCWGNDNTFQRYAAQMPFSFTIPAYSASDDNVVSWPAHANLLLTQLTCRTQGTDNVTVTLYECDSSAANCATTGLSVVATSTPATDSSASNGSIDENDWINVSLSSLQGTATAVNCSVRYAITGQ